MNKNRRGLILHTTKLMLLSFTAFILLYIIIMPLGFLLDYEYPLTTRWSAAKNFFVTLIPDLRYWVIVYFKWLIASKENPANFLPLLPPIVALYILIFRSIAIPKAKALTKKITRCKVKITTWFSTFNMLRNTGLLTGEIFALGRWKNALLMLPEAGSVISLSPSGAGKTSTIVVPSILRAGRCSLIIHDIKSELATITSGYRATHSRVYILAWTEQYRPEDEAYYPSWNPLSPQTLPIDKQERKKYVDQLVALLIENENSDKTTQTAINAQTILAGFTYYLIEKTEQRNYDTISENWHGKEASLPMLQQWVSHNFDKESNITDDVTTALIDTIITEARVRHYHECVIEACKHLYTISDKDRISALSVMNHSLAIFKNPAVAERTAYSDFSFDEFRGIWNEEKQHYEPVTLYLCTNQDDSHTLSPITALFIEALSTWLIAHPPNSTTKNGDMLGDCPAAFILDDFPQLPKLKASIENSAIGYQKKLSYLIIGQHIEQIQEKYSPSDMKILFSTAMAKITLPFNNAAKIRMLLQEEECKSIPEGKQIILHQQYPRSPIIVDSLLAYYNDASLKQLVHKTHGGSYDTAPPMPNHLTPKKEDNMLPQSLKTSLLAASITLTPPHINHAASTPASEIDHANVQIQAEEEASPYPDIWGRKLEDLDREIVSNPLSRAYKMDDGDIAIVYRHTDGLETLAVLYFFANRLVKITDKAERTKFYEKNRKNEIDGFKAYFKDGTYYEFWHNSNGTCYKSSLYSFFKLYDPKGKAIGGKSLLEFLDPPQRTEFGCRHKGEFDNMPDYVDFPIGQLAMANFGLGDDTFLTYINGHVVRVRKDLSTDYPDAPEYFVMDFKEMRTFLRKHSISLDLQENHNNQMKALTAHLKTLKQQKPLSHKQTKKEQ